MLRTQTTYSVSIASTNFLLNGFEKIAKKYEDQLNAMAYRVLVAYSDEASGEFIGGKVTTHIL